jgi:hypothetical protein
MQIIKNNNKDNEPTLAQCHAYHELQDEISEAHAEISPVAAIQAIAGSNLQALADNYEETNGFENLSKDDLRAQMFQLANVLAAIDMIARGDFGQLGIVEPELLKNIDDVWPDMGASQLFALRQAHDAWCEKHGEHHD